MDTTPFPNQADDAVTEPSYERDVVAWANEQARRLRAGEFHRLDIEHIADEIEDVGKSEQQELVNRMGLADRPSPQVAVSAQPSQPQLGKHHP